MTLQWEAVFATCDQLSTLKVMTQESAAYLLFSVTIFMTAVLRNKFTTIMTKRRATDSYD